MIDGIDVPDPLLWAGVAGLLLIGFVLLIDQKGKSGQRDAATGLGGWDRWRRVLSRKAAVKQARVRIPKEAAEDEDAVVFTGYAGNNPVYLQHWDSMLIYGIPQSGKTRNVGRRQIAEAPGPVASTSTKIDAAMATAEARATKGLVLAYDPMGTLPDSAGITRLKWDPIRGCEDPEVALRRAAAWAAAQPLGNVKNGDWFNQRAAELLAPLLHAAALGGYDIIDVQQWSDKLEDRTPRDILDESGPRGWGDKLASTAGSRAGETVDSLKMTLSGIMGALASPRICATLTPAPEEHFDPAEFLTGTNTLYLLAGEDGGSIIAPVFTMLLDELLYQAGRESQRRPGGFLWPPFRVVADEIANIAPVRDLERHMSDSGGRGIQVEAIVQSHAQMRQRWGPDGAEAIRSAASAKLYLPGITEEYLTRDLERIAGRRRVTRVSTSSNRQGGSTSRSREWEDVLPQSKVPDLPPGQAWLQYRSLPIGKLRMPVWAPPKQTLRSKIAGWVRDRRAPGPDPARAAATVATAQPSHRPGEAA